LRVTAISALLILATLALPLLFIDRKTHSIAPLMFLSCAVHCAATYFQNEMLKSVTADAHLYYFDLDSYMSRPLVLGTSSIVYFTQFVKNTFGFEFIDIMYLFSMAGAAMVLILMRWISLNAQGNAKWLGCALCFLPGLQFWTSTIGKDAPMALGLILLVVGLQDIRKNMPAVIVGGVLCLIIRPHIFVILAAAYPIAHILRNRGIMLRVFAIGLAMALIPIVRIIVEAFLGIDILDTNQIYNIVSDRQGYFVFTTDEGVTFIQNPLVRIVYFTFSPFFYDADSVLSLISSLANLALICIMIRIIFSFTKITDGYKITSTFLAIFVAVMVLFLGFGGYNVGLALRQKIMFYPALLMLFLLGEAGYAARKAGKAANMPFRSKGLVKQELSRVN
jgi:hypothetical protein